MCVVGRTPLFGSLPRGTAAVREELAAKLSDTRDAVTLLFFVQVVVRPWPAPRAPGAPPVQTERSSGNPLEDAVGIPIREFA